MSKLFTPLMVGRVEVPFRMAMAPMTRLRSDDESIPLPIVKEYYSQRSKVPGSFLVSEGTFISPKAAGYLNAPGIYSLEQIAAWKEVTDAVHANKSSIYLQLWALGRAANAEALGKRGDFQIVSSSPVPLDENSPIPHALTEEEVWGFIGDYAQAARNAISAGFDGVEIHGANGYLVDQFIQDTVNQRTDAWGGSVQNRARFALEVTKAVSAAVGANRTAIRLSPWNTFQGMRMENDKILAQYMYLAEQLKDLHLAYVHIVEPRIRGTSVVDSTKDSAIFFLQAYDHASPVMMSGGYSAASAEEAVDTTYNDYDVIIGFARPYISNPDLPFRVKERIDLAPYDRSTFYAVKSVKGYHDYPFCEQFTQAVKATV
jgi:NADPH2 dehydrogenase